MFAMTVRTAGRIVRLKWDDGELTGDPAAVLVIQDMARVALRQGRPLGPPEGPWATTPYLKDPIGAATLMSEFADEILSVTGDLPSRDDDPELR